VIEDKAAQHVVELCIGILKSRGVAPSPESMILDFGCGSGRHTYEYVDAGFQNTCGYDIRSYVDLRSPRDRDRFRFDPMREQASGDYPSMTAIPWPDHTFDFVFATSVFEHVSDQGLAYREIHRVLKPGGRFLNIFPAKWKPLEAHTNIPFGGVFASRPYLKLWALLGVRGAGQEELSVDQVVERNRLFALYGVNYLSGAQIARILRQTFGEFEYVEDAFMQYSPGRSRHLAIPLNFVPLLRQVFRFAHTRVILSQKAQG
jgi:SAM-dependent methyltransferase